MRLIYVYDEKDKITVESTDNPDIIDIKLPNGNIVTKSNVPPLKVKHKILGIEVDVNLGDDVWQFADDTFGPIHIDPKRPSEYYNYPLGVDFPLMKCIRWVETETLLDAIFYFWNPFSQITMKYVRPFSDGPVNYEDCEEIKKILKQMEHDCHLSAHRALVKAAKTAARENGDLCKRDGPNGSCSTCE